MRKKAPNPIVMFSVAGVVLVAGLGLAYMEFNTLQETQGRIVELKKEVRDEESVGKDLVAAKAKLGSITAEINHLERGVTNNAYIPTLLKELEQVGRDNGIEVLGVRPMPEPEVDRKKMKEERMRPYKQLMIEVKARGPYRRVLAFVRSLNTFPKVVAARTVSVTPKQTQGRYNGLLDVSFELRAYVFKEQEKPEEKSSDESSDSKPTAAVEGADRNG